MAGHTTSTATSAETNLAYGNIGLSAINSIASAYLTTKAFEQQLEAKTESQLKNMENQVNSFELNAFKLKEDMAVLDDAFANKVSDRMLQSMKDTATMRAAAAETGTTGGSTDTAVLQATVDANFDIAIINAKRKEGNRQGLRKHEQAQQQAINNIRSIASDKTTVKSNALFAGLAGFSSATGALLSTMPKSVLIDMFGMDNVGYGGEVVDDIYAVRPAQ